MIIITFCAKCGNTLRHQKQPFKNIETKRVGYDDIYIYVEPCPQCSDVEKEVHKIIRQAYKSVEDHS